MQKYPQTDIENVRRRSRFKKAAPYLIDNMNKDQMERIEYVI